MIMSLDPVTNLFPLEPPTYFCCLYTVSAAAADELNNLFLLLCTRAARRKKKRQTLSLSSRLQARAALLGTGEDDKRRVRDAFTSMSFPSSPNRFTEWARSRRGRENFDYLPAQRTFEQNQMSAERMTSATGRHFPRGAFTRTSS